MSRDRRAVLILTALLYFLSGGAQQALAHEFIWRDRWQRMGTLFQIGYIVGIDDALQVLSGWYGIFGTPKGVVLQNSLRRAHACVNEFKTVRDAVAFAAKAMSKQSDPFIPAQGSSTIR